MKNVKTKIGMVLGSLLAAMIFMACEADAGTPDMSSIKAIYNVDVKKVEYFSGSRRDYRYCLSDGVYYDSENSTSYTKKYLGTGYVVRLYKWSIDEHQFLIDCIEKYENDVLVCTMETWDSEGLKFVNIDESGSKVNFDIFTVKVHDETFSNNYMINVSCTNADKAQAQ